MAPVQAALFALSILLFLPSSSGQSKATDPLLVSIQDALTSGDLNAANALLETALRTHPDDGGLLNLRGVVHAQRSQFAEARRDFARAVELSPGLVPAWQNLARACQTDAAKEQVECASRAWKHVLQFRPSDREAKLGLALAYERAGSYSESLQWLSQLPAQDPNSQTAGLMVRCLDLVGLNRMTEASAAAKHLGEGRDFEFADLLAMEPLLDAPRAAVVTVILCDSLDSRSKLPAEGLRLLAVAYENANRFSDARKTLERAAAQEPVNPAHLLELARVAEKAKDREGALGYLGHARELTPNDPQVHYLFGMIAAEMNLPIEARRSFERALELAPENPVYNYAMGTAILSTRDAATAASYFQKYVDAKPDDPRGRYALGIAEFASGDYVKARAQMASVEHEASVAGGAEYFLGRMARLDGDLNGAKQHLAKAIRLLPAFAESHTELARVWLLEDKQAEALTELQLALKLDPNSFQANAQLLAIYKRTHDERAETQSEFLKKLDEERSRRAELMLRTVEIRP